jgi:hypothetical protein
MDLIWVDESGQRLWFGLFRFALARNAGNVGIVGPHLKQGSLLGGVPLQLVQIEFAGIAGRTSGFVLALNAAFGLVALFLLARVFFLAFGKTGSTSSWHSNLQSFVIHRTSAQRLKPLLILRRSRRGLEAAPLQNWHGKAGPFTGPRVELPAGFPGLARVALIIVATAAASATEALAAPTASAPGSISLWLRFVDLKGAPAEFRSVQCRDRLVGFRRIRHLDKAEAASAASFTVGDDTDAFDCAMRFKQAA